MSRERRSPTNAQPVLVPGGNTDPATEPYLVPIYIASIMACHDAERLLRDHGHDHPAARDAATRARGMIQAAAGTILRARSATR